MRLASPRRCRRNLGPGVTLERMGGTVPVYLEGIACQPLPAAIAAASKTMGVDRAIEAASEALARGYISKEEEERIKEEITR